MSTTPWIAGNLTDEQRAVFYSQMSVVQKDEVVGVLLAALYSPITRTPRRAIFSVMIE